MQDQSKSTIADSTSNELTVIRLKTGADFVTGQQIADAIGNALDMARRWPDPLPEGAARHREMTFYPANMPNTIRIVVVIREARQ